MKYITTLSLKVKNPITFRYFSLGAMGKIHKIEHVDCMGGDIPAESCYPTIEIDVRCALKGHCTHTHLSLRTILSRRYMCRILTT